MTRSRLRKLQRELAKRKRNIAAFGPFAAAMAFAAPMRAQETAEVPAQERAQASTAGQVEDIIVTSQKRSENMQDVPVSITALGAQKLEDLGVDDFDDYAKLPLLYDTPIKSKGDLLNHILTTHFASHLGQLSSWRRLMGLPPLF